MRWSVTLALGLLLTSARLPASPPSANVTFTTLGTAGGPVVVAERSQPANLLETASGRYMIDVGDGAVERLAAAGLRPSQIDGVFVSHLHLDHVGGLQGLIGLRWMTETPRPLMIYGPPGTDELVAGIVASLRPSARIGFGMGKPPPPPDSSVKVLILRDGGDVTVGDLRVRAARNTHFAIPAGDDGSIQSLSYRFDLPGRSIGYTGDTGPSDAVAALFEGVDLLVSEVIDLPATIAVVRKQNPQMPKPVVAQLIAHLEHQHLTPEQAGALAAASGAKLLVLTHLAIAGSTAMATPTLLAGVKQRYAGEVRVAHDLERF